MGYPFWEKNRADRESSRAFNASRDAEKSKELLAAIDAEIKKFKSLEPNARTNEKLIEVLDKISEILS